MRLSEFKCELGENTEMALSAAKKRNVSKNVEKYEIARSNLLKQGKTATSRELSELSIDMHYY